MRVVGRIRVGRALLLGALGIGCHSSRSREVVARDTVPIPLVPVAGALDSAAASTGWSTGWWTRIQTSFFILPDSDADDGGTGYEGHDGNGIPYYATQLFSQDDSLILRRAFGIESPHRLYLSDSSDSGVLMYDTQVKPCRSCLVNSYAIGFVSIRRPGETWEQAERRVKATPHRRFTGSPVPTSYSTADLDPVVRPAVERMLIDAAMVGFKLRVIATYRSPIRQAFLMSLGGNRTHTLTSSHSYGRALDIVVDDGDRGHKKTKADWIAFRTWLVNYRAPTGHTFRIVGKLDRTWDWPHVEVSTDRVGFRTIEEAIARGRECLAMGSTTPCDFMPNLPERLRR